MTPTDRTEAAQGPVTAAYAEWWSTSEHGDYGKASWQDVFAAGYRAAEARPDAGLREALAGHRPILERLTGTDDYQLACSCDVDLFIPGVEEGEAFMRHIAVLAAASPASEPAGLDVEVMAEALWSRAMDGRPPHLLAGAGPLTRELHRHEAAELARWYARAARLAEQPSPEGAPADAMPISEAAALLGVTPDYIRHQCQPDSGRLANHPGLLAQRIGTVKVGRDWLCSRAAVQAEIARRAVLA